MRGGPTGSDGDGLVTEVEANPARAGWLTTRVSSKAAGVNGRSGYRVR